MSAKAERLVLGAVVAMTLGSGGAVGLTVWSTVRGARIVAAEAPAPYRAPHPTSTSTSTPTSTPTPTPTEPPSNDGFADARPPPGPPPPQPRWITAPPGPLPAPKVRRAPRAGLEVEVPRAVAAWGT